MRAWAARMAGRRRESFCEQCGAPGVVRVDRQVADRPHRNELLLCHGCALLTCPTCWPGPFLSCRACVVRQDPMLVTLVGGAPARRLATAQAADVARGRSPRPTRAGLAAAALIGGVALTAGVLALTRPAPGSGSGGVAGVTAGSTPTAVATTRVASAAPTAPGASAPSPDPTPDPTSDPVSGGPADLRTTSSAVLPWADALGELRAQVIVGVTNRGGTASYLPSAATTYAVLSPDGFAVARGRFAHVFPRLVEPGATAWLVDALSATFAEPSELATISVTLDERPATIDDAAEPQSLTVTDMDWRLDAQGRLSVSGTVENLGPTSIARWSAGVILVDAAGRPLAAAYDIGAGAALAPGATASFSTDYPGSGPIAADEVADAIAIAVPLD